MNLYQKHMKKSEFTYCFVGNLTLLIGTMLEMVKSVLDCSMDPTTYEDTLRNMFGIHAYIGFTLDRIVSYAVRQVGNKSFRNQKVI